nr:hypothetical protein CFP56_34885 [Quercus suber]
MLCRYESSFRPARLEVKPRDSDMGAVARHARPGSTSVLQSFWQTVRGSLIRRENACQARKRYTAWISPLPLVNSTGVDKGIEQDARLLHVTGVSAGDTVMIRPAQPFCAARYQNAVLVLNPTAVRYAARMTICTQPCPMEYVACYALRGLVPAILLPEVTSLLSIATERASGQRELHKYSALG